MTYQYPELQAEVLAHYLKESAAIIDDEGEVERAKQAARTIRAAFEELAQEGADSEPLDTRPYEAQALARLVGQEEAYHYIDVENADDVPAGVAALVRAAYAELSRLQASASDSNPPADDGTRLEA